MSLRTRHLVVESMKQMLDISPHEYTERLNFTHMHQKRSYDESEPLAVPDLFIMQTEAFQYSPEHQLTYAALFPKHLDIGETPPDIFANQAFIRTGFCAEPLEFFVECTISCPGYTRPYHTSQRRRYTASYLVRCQSGQALCGLRIV